MVTSPLAQTLPRNFSIVGNLSRSDTLVQAVLPVACTLGPFRLHAFSAPSSMMTAAVYVNGVATAVGCSTAGTSCTSATTVAAAAGDLVMLVVSGPVSSPAFAASVVCQ